MESSQVAPQRPENTRSKSAFSFRSHKSSGSGDKLKIDLTETDKERRRNKFSGKGFNNPNRALQEAEPAARALELTTIASLGGSQYKDWQGNPITDPDSSNPARPRLERPLDTIRSFEAAAEGSRKKQQAARAESSLGFNNDSRRSSFVGTDVNINPRSSAAIPGAQMPRRMPSYQRDPSYDPYARAPPSSYSRRGMGSRMSSAPSQMDRSYSRSQAGYNYYNGPSGPGHDRYNGYPYHGQNESFDTNGDSTGSPSERWTNSTDPSSENSSIDRIHAINKQVDGSGDAYAGAYQNGLGYPNGAVQHDRSSPMPMRQQRQPITEESWNENRVLEGAYNYQGAPHQSGRPYQEQRSVSNMEGGMRGGAPPANYMPQQPQQQAQRGLQPNVTSPSAGKPFARNVMPLGGQNRPNPAPAPSQQYNQPQAQSSRPKTLRKESSTDKRSPEKPKSWLRRRFSKG